MRLDTIAKQLVLIAAFAASTVLFAQTKPNPAQEPPPEPAKPELGPNTPSTRQEIDSARQQPMRETVITAAPVDPRKYVIGPEDILRIVTWHETDFTFDVQVRRDGKVN